MSNCLLASKRFPESARNHSRGASLCSSILQRISTILAVAWIVATGATGSAHAQTAEQEVSLDNGWNAIWLEVEPVYEEGDSAGNGTIAAGDSRIGLPKAPTDVFNNPSISVIATPRPTAGLAEIFAADPRTNNFTPAEWQQWLRDDPTNSSNFGMIFGNRPYLSWPGV